MVILILFGFSGISHASQNPYISRHGVNFATGNKYLHQNDISLSGPVSTLSFSRGYNSQSDETSVLGYGWTFSWNDKLTFDTSTNTAVYARSDGRVSYFPYNGADAWESELGKKDVIIENTGGEFTLTQANGTKLVFDADGNLIEKRDLNNNSIILTYTSSQLTAISDGFGRSLTLAYNTEGKLETLATPIGTFTYLYDTNDNLILVTKPDSTVRTYLYEDTTDVHNLTGIIDETTTRILTVGYDAVDRVISSSLTGGSEAITIEYLPGYQRVLTDSLGVATTYQLEVTNGVAKVSSYTGPGCSSCGSDIGSEYFYDDRQLLTSIVDARGNTTSYTYDSLGNKLTETKAVGTTEEYTTTFTYDASLNKVDSITVPSVSNSGQNKVTSMTFDLTGNLLTRTEAGYSGTTAVTRTTTYTYDTYGRVLTIEGPRTDVSDTVTLTYYANETAQGNNRGFLHTVTNALGHTVAYSNYNGFGQAELITDANGVATSFVYNTAGRVSSRTTAGLTTSYTYDDAGTLISITLPGSRTISYTYNTEGQADTITDTLGNSITYSYDTEGRRTGQQIKDPSGTLKAYVDYTYDDAGRLHETINPDGGEEQLSYDEVGNLVTRINEVSLSTTYSYDALNRLATITEPGSATTTFTYDTHGNQTSVTDAEGNITSFTFDDFGNRLSRTSVDTGTTTYTYDTAGNLASKTDANSVTVSYTYDALNRLAAISYPDSTLIITYVYDQGTNGIGRLSSVTDATGSSNYTYNQFGNLTEEVRITSGESFTTAYGYNTNQELTSITYPSGRVVHYQRDAIGQVSDVTSTYQSVTTDVATNISYLPFGPSTSMTFGNGLVIGNSYDQQYRLTSSSAGSVYDKSYSYILTGQVDSITDNLNPLVETKSFSYDDLGRLISANWTTGNFNYTYDLIGNRLTETSIFSAATQYTYQSGNNRLQQTIGAETIDYTYDTAGNTLTKGTTSFSWNDDNRLESIAVNSITQGTYGYDARGLRTIKTTDKGTILSVYDLAGNLIVEADAEGDAIREYVYLNSSRICFFNYTKSISQQASSEQTIGILQVLSDINVTAEYSSLDVDGNGQVNLGDAVDTLRAQAGIGRYYYISDHLNTSQLITDDAGNVVWQGDYQPFGNVDVVVDDLNNHFRFPGQILDTESGLHYNWHRFYDPSTGRYISADPIGLDGGMNLYAYVGGDPVNAIDPSGEVFSSIDSAIQACLRLPTVLKRIQCLEGLGCEIGNDAKGKAKLLEAISKQKRLLKTAQEVLAEEVKGSARSQFPSEMLNKTLEQIQKLAKRGNKAAKTAWKLLSSNRFKK